MGENEMVERVARAIEDRLRGKDFLSYEEAARAAIEAMREPTEAFIEALAERMHDGRFSVSGEDYPVARNFIRAFADAALSPGTGK